MTSEPNNPSHANPDQNRTVANAVRCVVLTTNGPAPRDLIGSLQRREVQVTEANDVFGAMAAILGLLRAGADDQPVGLIAVDPAAIARADELLRAIERTCSHVARWRYDEKAKERLAAWRIEAPAEKPQVVVRNGAAMSQSVAPSAAPPALRLAGGDLDERHDAGDADPEIESLEEEAGIHSVLTPEELAMLLSDPSDEDRAGPVRGADA